MNLRKAIFWLHLAAGLVGGLAIGVMCATGTLLAFEKELVAWSERDARQIAAPAPGAARFSLSELQERFRQAQPDARPSSLVLQNDPRAAVAFTTGRSGGFYVNPYTGEVREPQSTAMSTFLRHVTEWHRYLGFGGEVSRPRGKAINGVCNLAFCALALTGIYLWMPRSWSWRSVRAVLWFQPRAAGKARDFNWHNTIGFWCAPVLVVLTLTAIPISFRWGTNLIYTLTGTAIPAGGPVRSDPTAGLHVDLPPAPAGTAPLKVDALFAAAQRAAPDWKTLTLRLSEAPPPGRGHGGERRATAARSGPQPAVITVRETTSWPRTATTTLLLHPNTGDVLRRSGYANLPAPQRVRSWTRFLHTGEALGWIGQAVAALACLGGVFLVYTGFALSWRRFFGRKT